MALANRQHQLVQLLAHSHSIPAGALNLQMVSIPRHPVETQLLNLFISRKDWKDWIEDQQGTAPSQHSLP